VNACWSTAPARPLASTNTVSLVERQPSTDRQSKALADGLREAHAADRRGSRAAIGRDDREHRRHRGRQTSPRPSPYRRPSRRRRRGANRFLPLRVGWSSSPAPRATARPSAASSPHSFGDAPPRARSIGIGMPMRPRRAQRARRRARPPSPRRGQLATCGAASRRPPLPRRPRWRLPRAQHDRRGPSASPGDGVRPWTGAAWARFVVKTPARGSRAPRRRFASRREDRGSPDGFDPAGEAAGDEPVDGGDARGSRLDPEGAGQARSSPGDREERLAAWIICPRGAFSRGLSSAAIAK